MRSSLPSDDARMAKSIPRYVHPGAWWLWALCLAAAASRTTNPIILLLILAVTGLVVAARKPDAPWARSFTVFLKLGVLVIVIRVAFQVALGTATGTHTLLSLPVVPLPTWLAGIRLGGDITLESIILAACDGLRLAVLIACVGAANSLASASRLLKALPPALYEVGVAVVVAMTFAPQLVTDIGRVKQARRLRGRPSTGFRGVTGSALPVFEGALDRAVALAAAMDARGYGRSAELPRRVRIATMVLVIGGMIALCIGLYGLLSAATPTRVSVPIFALGLVAALGGMWLGGRRSIRTRYRPDPWRAPEWIVTASGIAALAGVTLASINNPAALEMTVSPLMWPQLPPAALLGVLIAATPAFLTPPLPAPAKVRRDPGARAGLPDQGLVAST